ncbi:MAG: hypothetical protein II752_08855, partial [Muribaculaceae bacterium]|nr:hypothetical protein [Muribaculaceae bacterium]
FFVLPVEFALFGGCAPPAAWQTPRCFSCIKHHQFLHFVLESSQIQLVQIQLVIFILPSFEIMHNAQRIMRNEEPTKWLGEMPKRELPERQPTVAKPSKPLPINHKL